MNRKSNFKVIYKIKFHAEVACERGITQSSQTGVIILVVSDVAVHNDDIFQV